MRITVILDGPTAMVSLRFIVSCNILIFGYHRLYDIRECNVNTKRLIKMSESLEIFLASEKKYFEPMLERQRKYTERELTLFREETVHGRRERVSLELFEAMKKTVGYGPFCGMRLSEQPWWGKSDLGSMCLGLYEKEMLNALISDQLSERTTFIDIGAADGYYAIGLLLSKNYKKSICFELTELGRKTIDRNWNLNACPGDIEIHGDVLTDAEKVLASVDMSKAVTLIDVEGAEFELLNSNLIELLSGSVVLIEIHNWVDDFLDKYTAMLKRCSKHFDIDVVKREDRSTVEFNELRSLTDDSRLLLTSEGRPCLMRFLVLTPRAV